MATYVKWLESVMNDQLASASIKCMLVTSAYTQADTDQFRSDIADEISGTGYTAGGLAATGLALSTTDGVVSLTCDNIVFGVISATDIAGAIFYVDTGSASTDVLIAADLFGPVDVSSVSAYTYVCDPSGVVAAYAE